MFPAESPFPKTDALLREWGVLSEAYRLARSLPDALMSAYGCSSMFGLGDYDYSLEQVFDYSHRDVVDKLRELRNWLEEVDKPEVTAVPTHLDLTNVYANLTRFREGYGFLVFFYGVVQEGNKSFPDYFQQQLERLALQLRGLQETR